MCSNSAERTLIKMPAIKNETCDLALIVLIRINFEGGDYDEDEDATRT